LLAFAWHEGAQVSRQRYEASTPQQRDQADDDRDEAALRRDQASVLRDREAAIRDELAEERLVAAEQYAKLTRHVLDTAAAREHSGGDERVARDLLRHLEQALSEAGQDRRASLRDRQAAAEDRDQAAEDRDIKAEHRGQAAIERAQRASGLAEVSHERWAGLYARALTARTRARELAEQAQAYGLAPSPETDVLRHSELARLRARLTTMPVIEQAKGIIMAQSGCDGAHAFDVLKQASQRRNEPIRELAERIVSHLHNTQHN